MYKSRLQELCHQKGWTLPNYSPVKEGPDHNPYFTASITVNGVSFQTKGFYKTSKEAQNEAAMIAYEHFTTPSLPSPLPLPLPLPLPRPQVIFIPHHRAEDAASSTSGSSGVSNKMKDKTKNELNDAPAIGGNKSPKNQEISKSPLIHGNASVIKDEFEGVQSLYKNQLQSYAQRHNISLPTYSCVREGLAHALCFKAKVTIDGQTFESPGFFHTLKEAEHAAAKAALMSLSLDGTEMEESAVYKNLLQELTQKEGLSLPVYTVKQSGASHIPTFSSTVEIDGEVFHGKAAKTKKQAEMNAAKVAYFDLKERRSTKMANYLHPSSQALGATTCSSSNSVDSIDLQQKLKPIDMAVSTTIAVSEGNGKKRRDGNQEVDSEKVISVSAKVSTHNSIPSPKPSNMTMRNTEYSSSDMIYAGLRDPFPSIPSSPDDGPSSPSTASEYSDNFAVESDIKVPTAKETSSLLCNRVRIYPRMPNMVLPKDITILPISDDKWVAVSLEFPDLAVQ